MSEPHTPALSLAELQALIATKEQEAETLTETLGAMWQQRQAGTLPREQYTDYLYYEDQLRVTLQTLERMQPHLTFAEVREKITTGKAHHDRYCEQVDTKSLRVCQAFSTLVQECDELQTLVDEQIDPLTLLTRPNQQPMFELDTGRTTLVNMLAVIPGLRDAVLAFLPFRSGGPTVGHMQAMLSHVKGREPFSETNVERYLAEYRIEEPKPETAVEDL